MEIDGQKPLRRLLHALQSQDPKRFGFEDVLQKVSLNYAIIIIHLKFWFLYSKDNAGTCLCQKVSAWYNDGLTLK